MSREIGSLSLYGASVLSLAAWAFVPISWVSYGSELPGSIVSYDTITILTPSLQGFLFWLAAGVAVLLLVGGVVSLRWRVIRWPGIALMLSLVGFPLAGLSHAVSNLGPWTICDRIETNSGDLYAFCDSSFMQGQLMALTRVESENFLVTRLKVLGVTNGDSPRSWASVIRPANPKEHYGQLYLTDENFLVGIRYGNHCFMAYDISKQYFIGRDEIKEVSPFVCLDAAQSLHQDDVTEVEKARRALSPGDSGYPSDAAIASGREHANPEVRKTAEMLLSEGAADRDFDGELEK